TADSSSTSSWVTRPEDKKETKNGGGRRTIEPGNHPPSTRGASSMGGRPAAAMEKTKKGRLRGAALVAHLHQCVRPRWHTPRRTARCGRRRRDSSSRPAKRSYSCRRCRGRIPAGGC